LQKQLDDILRGWNELNTLPEHTPDEIEAKKARYLAFTQSKDAWLLHPDRLDPHRPVLPAEDGGQLAKIHHRRHLSALLEGGSESARPGHRGSLGDGGAQALLPLVSGVS
jgi:hypothetical protein